MNLSKNVIKGVRFYKVCLFGYFLYYFLVKISIHRLLFINIVYKPPYFHIFVQNKHFSEASYIYTIRIVDMMPPTQDFDEWYPVTSGLTWMRPIFCREKSPPPTRGDTFLYLPKSQQKNPKKGYFSGSSFRKCCQLNVWHNLTMKKVNFCIYTLFL